MEVNVFIENFRKAFGKGAQLPFVFWYSNEPVDDRLEKIGGCFFQRVRAINQGRGCLFECG